MAGITTGRLNRKIIIQRVAEVQDEIGQPVQTWSTLSTVWADVQPITGKEALNNDRNLSSATSRFIIHFYDGLTTKDRISFDSKLFDILYIREIGFKAGIEILAELRV